MGGIYDVSITSLCTKGAFTCVGITSSEGSKIWKPFSPPPLLQKFCSKNLHFTFDLGKIVDSDVQGQTTVVVWGHNPSHNSKSFAHNTTTTASEYNHIYH